MRVGGVFRERQRFHVACRPQARACPASCAGVTLREHETRSGRERPTAPDTARAARPPRRAGATAVPSPPPPPPPLFWCARERPFAPTCRSSGGGGCTRRRGIARRRSPVNGQRVACRASAGGITQEMGTSLVSHPSRGCCDPGPVSTGDAGCLDCFAVNRSPLHCRGRFRRARPDRALHPSHDHLGTYGHFCHRPSRARAVSR